MIAFAGEAHRLHDPPYSFRRGLLAEPFERPARVDELRAALADLDITVHSPVEHELGALSHTHTPDLIHFLRTGWAEARRRGAPEVLIPDIFAHERLVPRVRNRSDVAEPARPGSMCFDCSSPLLEGTWIAAAQAADLALSAAEAVAAGEHSAYALCRPPGHHAGADFYGGFCYLNNAAIAARHLQRIGRRVAVLDLDIHHGNGTQAIFWNDPEVLSISIHQHPSYGYPYFAGYPDEEGGSEALGANRNLTLNKGCDDRAYARVLDIALDQVQSFGADVLVVPLGLDGHMADPLAETALTASGYAAFGASIGALRLQTVIVQEGGYATAVLRDSLRCFLGGMAR